MPTVAILIVGLFAARAEAAGGPREQPPIPDLTRGGTPDKNHDWTLGPTGARGWIYAWKLETSDARQIYVTKVDKGSPADGSLEPGDVILGIDGRPFTSDARIAFGRAVTRVEAGETQGRLSLVRWRDGKTQPVEIRMSVLGAYGATAPYACEKSKRIFEQGCHALARQMKASRKRGNPIERSLNALVLLASEDPRYLPLVEEEARWAAGFSIPEDEGFHSWWYGYVNLFLAEYVMLTGDRSVLPGMERLTLAIANGQSDVGTWGHRFAQKHNGILQGYGAMNAPGLSLTMSLVLAREAGISDPKLDEAIDKSRRMLSFYIDKGAIPYGDHHPFLETHEDNGKCGAGAVMFDFLGDVDGASFFSRMSTASHGAERDGGHTGNFFNLLWSLPGVSRSGPEATGAWVNEFGWYLDMARRWDGTFIYQGEPGTSARTSAHKYADWDSTGAYLLGYAASLKTLRLTGRKASVAPQLNAEEARCLIADGRDWSQREKSKPYSLRSTAELLTGLCSWSPVVRERCALAIGDRKQGAPVPQLVTLLESDDIHARLGACAALEALGPAAAPAVDLLRETLAEDDLWLRVQAAETLSAIGADARSAVPDLLELTVKEHPEDPRRMTQRYLAFLLFHRGRIGNVRGMLSTSLDGVDRKQLVKAVRAVLNNEDGRARGAVDSVFDHLTFDEIEPLLPVVYRAIVEQAPSGVMFSDRIRLSGLALLAKHRIAEGIPLCIPLTEPHRWGKKRRIGECLKALRSYGGTARSQLPALHELEQQLKTHEEAKMLADVIEEVRVIIDEIESSTDAPRLRSIPLR